MTKIFTWIFIIVIDNINIIFIIASLVILFWWLVFPYLRLMVVWLNRFTGSDYLLPEKNMSVSIRCWLSLSRSWYFRCPYEVIMFPNRITRAYLLFIILRSACLSKSLCKGIMINLQLCNLFILISRHADELGLFEDVRPEGGVGQLEDVVGADQVEPGLVLVHGVQDGLQLNKGLSKPRVKARGVQ